MYIIDKFICKYKRENMRRWREIKNICKLNKLLIESEN